MGPFPTHFTFGRQAAKQIADAVRRVERAPRNRPRHRRRSVTPVPQTNSKWVTFLTPTALTSQASLPDCAVILDWNNSTGGITTITVYNEMGWQADAGVEGYAKWRPADSKWILMLIPCPTGES